MSRKFAVTCMALLMALSASVQADDDDKIIIHGFGGWAYSTTDGYTYRGVTEDGVWDRWDIGLNINAFITDDIRVNVQLYGDGYLQDDNFDIDYAFVEYSLNEYFKIRAGKVKHPFGVYGEVKKVGIVRTFYDLPQSTYGHDLFVSSGYNGVGLVLDNFYRGDWGLYLHAYAGTFEGVFTGVNFSYLFPRLIFNLPLPDQELAVTLDSNTENVLGIYASVETPFNGMKIGGSYVQGDVDLQIVAAETKVYNGFLEYNYDPILVRAEISRSVYGSNPSEDYDFGYIEAGFKLTEQVQPVFRYDFDSRVRKEGAVGPTASFFDVLPELARSEEVAFGVNFFLSPELILRASYHAVNGFHWVVPDNVEGYLGSSDTKMFTIGTQFSF